MDTNRITRPTRPDERARDPGAQLLDGSDKPQPVRRVEIPKASGGTRALGIPTVLDRKSECESLELAHG
jgi:retron-type reverse transcriptase